MRSGTDTPGVGPIWEGELRTLGPLGSGRASPDEVLPGPLPRGSFGSGPPSTRARLESARVGTLITGCGGWGEVGGTPRPGRRVGGQKFLGDKSESPSGRPQMSRTPRYHVGALVGTRYLRTRVVSVDES